MNVIDIITSRWTETRCTVRKEGKKFFEYTQVARLPQGVDQGLLVDIHRNNDIIDAGIWELTEEGKDSLQKEKFTEMTPEDKYCTFDLVKTPLVVSYYPEGFLLLVEENIYDNKISYRRLGCEPKGATRWYARGRVGPAELCDFDAEVEDFVEIPGDIGDPRRASFDQVPLEDINWTHRKGMASLRDLRLEKVLLHIEKFESLHNLRMLTKVAEWARRMAFSNMRREKGFIKDERGRALEKLGFDYKRFAICMNATTRAAARLMEKDTEKMPKPFGLYALKDFEGNEKELWDGDAIDAPREGLYKAENLASLEEIRVSFSKRIAKVVKRPLTYIYRNEDYPFGPRALHF